MVFRICIILGLLPSPLDVAFSFRERECDCIALHHFFPLHSFRQQLDIHIKDAKGMNPLYIELSSCVPLLPSCTLFFGFPVNSNLAHRTMMTPIGPTDDSVFYPSLLAFLISGVFQARHWRLGTTPKG